MRKFDLKKMIKQVKNRKQRRLFILFLTKLGYSIRDIDGKVGLARHVITNMTGNPNFTTPVPALSEVGDAADTLETTQAALDGSKAKTLARNAAEKVLAQLMKQLQSYVDTTANGNSEVIISSGMEVRNPRTKTGLLGPVTDVNVKLGLLPKTVDLSWTGIKRSKLYLVEKNVKGQPENWDFAGETTKSKITIGELQSGVEYEFRITCISSGGIGPFTAPVSIKAY